MAPPPRVLALDVNETLLDLGALDPVFARALGDAALRPVWFAGLLQTALVATVTDRYRPFGELALGAFEAVGAQVGRPPSEAGRRALKEGMATMPAHPDARPGLERLRAAGFRLVALTNSPADSARARLGHAGLADLLDDVLSAEAVRRFKPAPEVYRMAAERVGVPPAGLRLVAAHGWDVTGAIRAGLAAAFVARPGQVLDPTGERPDVIGHDLLDVARQLEEQAA